MANRFKIVLAEKTNNMQEAAERSKNNWQNEQKQKKIIKAEQEIKQRKAGPFSK